MKLTTGSKDTIFIYASKISLPTSLIIKNPDGSFEMSGVIAPPKYPFDIKNILKGDNTILVTMYITFRSSCLVRKLISNRRLKKLLKRVALEDRVSLRFYKEDEFPRFLEGGLEISNKIFLPSIPEYELFKLLYEINESDSR